MINKIVTNNVGQFKVKSGKLLIIDPLADKNYTNILLSVKNGDWNVRITRIKYDDLFIFRCSEIIIYIDDFNEKDLILSESKVNVEYGMVGLWDELEYNAASNNDNFERECLNLTRPAFLKSISNSSDSENDFKKTLEKIINIFYPEPIFNQESENIFFDLENFRDIKNFIINKNEIHKNSFLKDLIDLISKFQANVFEMLDLYFENNLEAGVMKNGVITSIPGYRCGKYNLFYAENDNKEIVAVKIVFIEN